MTRWHPRRFGWPREAAEFLGPRSEPDCWAHSSLSCRGDSRTGSGCLFSWLLCLSYRASRENKDKSHVLLDCDTFVTGFPELLKDLFTCQQPTLLPREAVCIPHHFPKSSPRIPHSQQRTPPDLSSSESSTSFSLLAPQQTYLWSLVFAAIVNYYHLISEGGILFLQKAKIKYHHSAWSTSRILIKL